MTGAAGPVRRPDAVPAQANGGAGSVTDHGRDGGSDSHAGSELAALRRQLRQVTAELDGPLRRVRMSYGDALLEIEWQPAVPADRPTRPPAPTPATVEATAPRRTVVSPLVGTFYRAPEPGAAPYVEVGDAIEAGQVIGIVEAMKLMNQVTAEQAGTVVAVLVDDGQPVEFEQPLVALAPGGPDAPDPAD
ncbi:acetyl-CoA carboxylase biotin carboxyl carrier protein [Solwaraspora sp. WMMD1047]|uniref:acetyl-CoA carboxylase biotin carboxyl carrier protein n=1 Tax=Solwaraspora sp. WMMD1047 TaxID=3016102 RepID=UPI002417100D|nr:acetyl-CoA carboxylase biotin carboxyl carrier protein [Solwaraspora sp. WMMD1047]MDG4831392.1 acetyl-CoA carboxylase biotin carboxyl carrier protein [Solwaraspora sp. WMMD1047]